MGQFDNKHPLGSVDDPAVQDPTAQATTIAALKGLLKSMGGGTPTGVLPTAAALSDTTANPTTPMIGAAHMVWDATQWLRAKASSIVSGAQLVDLATRLDSTNDSVTNLAGTTTAVFSFTRLRPMVI